MAHIQITASSRVGCIRNNNEDLILVDDALIRHSHYRTQFSTDDKSRLMLAVADGMGGHNCGEVASADTLSNLRYFFGDMPAHMNDNQIIESMNGWLRSICRDIDAKGHSAPTFRDMGTTLVAMFYYEGQYYWMNCGDSRLYRFHQGQLTQLTTDHSLSNVLGLQTHSYQIVNCIGGGTRDSYLDMASMTAQVEPGDVFVICSDGLSDMVTDDEICEFLQRGADADDLCDAAEAVGGYDNVSVIKISID